MNTFPYPDDSGQTHYENCYRERKHHNCAIAEVDRLCTEHRELVAENEWFAALLDDPKRLRKHIEEKMQEEKENKEARYDAMERDHWESIINNPASGKHADG